MSTETLQSILGSKPVSFYAVFAKAIGNVSSAVMLSQALFWQELAKYKRDFVEIDGKKFFQKTAAEWYDETGLTVEQQKTARKHLNYCGIMVEEITGVPATVHYHIDMNALIAVVENFMQNNTKALPDKRSEKRERKRDEEGLFIKVTSGKQPKLSIGKVPTASIGNIPNLSNGNIPILESVNNRNLNNKVLESLRVKNGEFKGEAPQAAFITTHTPDQIENVAVQIVEGKVFSLEAEKNAEGKVPPPAENETDTVVTIYRPPQETPALQSAGNFEANPTPQLLDLEAQSRDEQVFAAIEGKKTRTPKPAGNSTAAICAELKTPEVLDFFHAIHAAWGEWIDYKRREKKGTYKTAKTEAATITELANEVNCDAEAARAAIRRSIAKTYIGICPPSNKGKIVNDTNVARYSLEDRPQAQTPAQMKDELGRFYAGHKDLLAEVQQTAETNYGPERLKSIVTDFCSNRIGKGRQNETFGQHHAEFGIWLKRQKEFDAKNNPSNQQHGPQPQAQLRSVAPVNYSQSGPVLRHEKTE